MANDIDAITTLPSSPDATGTPIYPAPQGQGAQLIPGVWPKELPLPDRDGYGWTTAFGLQVSPQPGPDFQRRHYYGQPTQFTFAFRMTTAQLGKFHLFLQGYGYSWFTIDLPTAGAYLETKKDCMDTRLRFTSNPSVSMQGINMWAVNITGEIRSMLHPQGGMP